MKSSNRLEPLSKKELEQNTVFFRVSDGTFV